MGFTRLAATAWPGGFNRSAHSAGPGYMLYVIVYMLYAICYMPCVIGYMRPTTMKRQVFAILHPQKRPEMKMFVKLCENVHFDTPDGPQEHPKRLPVDPQEAPRMPPGDAQGA